MLAFCSCLTLGFKLIAPHLQPTPVFLPGKFHGQSCLAGATVHAVAKSQTRLSMHWLAGFPPRGSWYGNHLDCRGTAGCLKHQEFPIILGLQQLRSFCTCHCFQVTQKLAVWPWASTLPSLCLCVNIAPLPWSVKWKELDWPLSLGFGLDSFVAVFEGQLILILVSKQEVGMFCLVLFPKPPRSHC